MLQANCRVVLPDTLGVSVQGKPKLIENKLRQDLKSAVLANWQLWVPIQLINFAFVPVHLQVHSHSAKESLRDQTKEGCASTLLMSCMVLCSHSTNSALQQSVSCNTFENGDGVGRMSKGLVIPATPSACFAPAPPSVQLCVSS